MEQSLCSKHCVTRHSSDYLTYKTKQNLNFPFLSFFHQFMPNQFFDKKKAQENKGNKNLADFLNAPFSSQLVFYCDGQSFFLHGRIPTVLRGHQYIIPIIPIIIIPRLCLQATRQTNISFYLFMGTIKLSRPLSREEPQVIFAIPAKEHFAGTYAILVVCQQRKLRFRWSVVYGHRAGWRGSHCLPRRRSQGFVGQERVTNP